MKRFCHGCDNLMDFNHYRNVCSHFDTLQGLFSCQPLHVTKVSCWPLDPWISVEFLCKQIEFIFHKVPLKLHFCRFCLRLNMFNIEIQIWSWGCQYCKNHKTEFVKCASSSKQDVRHPDWFGIHVTQLHDVQGHGQPVIGLPDGILSWQKGHGKLHDA